MLFVFGCHDYGNGYFYKMWIWISYRNRCCYLIGYHLQTDGQIERVNQILEQYLHCAVNYQ
jgi:hypothetical protein